MKSLILGLFVFSPVVYANTEQFSSEVLIKEIQKINELNLEFIKETLILQLQYRLVNFQVPSVEADEAEVYPNLLSNNISENLEIIDNIESSSLLSWLENKIKSIPDSFKQTIEGQEFNVSISRNANYPSSPFLSIKLLAPFKKALEDIEGDFNYEEEDGEKGLESNWGPEATGLSGTIQSLVIHDITSSFVSHANLKNISIIMSYFHDKIEKYRDQFLILNQYINVLNLRGPLDVYDFKKINPDDPLSSDTYMSYIFLYLEALGEGLDISILKPLNLLSDLQLGQLETIKGDIQALINDIKAVCNSSEIETVGMARERSNYVKTYGHSPNL